MSAPARPGVLAAMSGGVDSSVAAMLLKDLGHRVVGVTLRLFGEELPGFGPLFDPTLSTGRGCCSLQDVLDAREAASKLDIDHQVHNFTLAFQKGVLEPFLAAYQSGRTPNPCVDCNNKVKFGPLIERAALMDLELVATGHYARSRLDPETGRWLLLKGLDPDKDQSYVLYGLSQEELSKTVFPLGELSKTRVRRLAEKRGLVTASKPDSQDICFVAAGGYASFIEAAGAAAEPGDIMDLGGRVLGRHRGVHLYTIGQRRGLGLSSPYPLHVLALDPLNKTVTVGPESALYASGANLSGLNLISIESLGGPIPVEAKIRYRQPPFEATLEPQGDGRARLLFHTPQKAVAPGQAAVFYQGDLVVGGGVIEAAI